MGNFRDKSNKQNTLIAWLFILPALIGTLVFIIIPVICSFSLSFADWDLINEIKFVGLNNYKTILTDHLFWQMLGNTFVYAISVSILGVILPLILACILNNKIRGSEFFKTAYFIQGLCHACSNRCFCLETCRIQYDYILIRSCRN